MREILFRGKRKYGGEWVEGSLICFADGCTFICVQGENMNFLDKFEVIPDTVGEYTGLTDKNGKKIFEGDIAKNQYEKNKYQYFKIFYCNRTNSWLVANKYGMLGKVYNVMGNIEVIGNIYDNPEILKGE